MEAGPEMGTDSVACLLLRTEILTHARSRYAISVRPGAVQPGPLALPFPRAGVHS
jgi:hypothetical protein